MRRIEFGTAFKRDYRRMMKRGAPAGKFDALILMLVRDEPLPARYRPHTLKGVWQGLLV